MEFLANEMSGHGLNVLHRAQVMTKVGAHVKFEYV